jgi:hypothetical protein
MKRKVLLLLLTVFFASFTSNAQVSITGVGATGGWGDGFDQDLVSTDGGHVWTIVGFTVPGGECKFRLNHLWTTNWGGTGFPSGTGTQDGPNIPAIAGTYDITFNQDTGEYTFGGGAPIPVVKLVGSAVPTPGGAQMTTADAETYTLTNITLVAGTAQFDIDGAVSGGDTFPTGNGTDPLLSVPVPAGDYSNVTININTGDYSFTLAPVYPVISVTGSAVGGWGDGFDFDMTTTDGVTYTYNGLAMIVGEAKFRVGHAWTTAYGDTAFPSGIATTTGGNIQVSAAGTYSVTFNLTTGAYTFSFPVISITGAAFGGWGDGFDFDLATTDGVNYSASGLVAVATDGAKFRTGHSWDITNYGGTDFPSGIASTDAAAANFPVVAGTYDVSLNTSTLAYSFAPLGTKNFSASNFKVYPNPSQNSWNFASAKESIQTLQIVDVLGKTVMTVNPKTTTVNVDASGLNAGIYFAKIATATSNQTVKVVKN